MNEKTFVDPDFKKIFESGPGLHLILDPRLYIVDASDAWLHATGIHRDDIIGRYVFEALPDNPDDPTADSVSIKQQCFCVLSVQEGHIYGVNL